MSDALDRLAGGCRFIAGEAVPGIRTALAGGPSPYCGAETEPGSAWCARHEAVVMTGRMAGVTLFPPFPRQRAA